MKYKISWSTHKKVNDVMEISNPWRKIYKKPLENGNTSYVHVLVELTS